MELTLKKARKLEGKIQSVMNELKVEPRVSIRAKSQWAVQDVLEAKNLLLASLDAWNTLNEARYSIRGQISQVNMKVGISDLMVKREQLRSSLSNLAKLANSPTTCPDDITDLQEAKKAQIARGDSYRLEVTVETSVLFDSDTKALQAKVKAVKAEIESIEDELIQKNAGAKITLSPGVVEVLKAHALV